MYNYIKGYYSPRWLWIGIPLLLILIIVIIWLLRDHRKVGYLRLDQRSKYCERPLTLHGWQELEKGECAQLHLNDGTRGIIIGPARLCVSKFKWTCNKKDGDVHMKLSRGTMIIQVEKSSHANQRTVELPHFIADLHKGRIGLHITRRKCGENLAVSLLDECARAGQLCIRNECRDLRWNLQAFRTNGRQHCSIPFMYPKEVKTIFGKCKALKLMNYMTGSGVENDPDEADTRHHRIRQRHRHHKGGDRQQQRHHQRRKSSSSSSRRRRGGDDVDAVEGQEDESQEVQSVAVTEQDDLDLDLDLVELKHGVNANDSESDSQSQSQSDSDSQSDSESDSESQSEFESKEPPAAVLIIDAIVPTADAAPAPSTSNATTVIATTTTTTASASAEESPHRAWLRHNDAIQLQSERGYCARRSPVVIGNATAIEAMILIVECEHGRGVVRPSTKFRLRNALASTAEYVQVDATTGKIIISADDGMWWKFTHAEVTAPSTTSVAEPLCLFKPAYLQHVDSKMYLTVSDGLMMLASRRTYPFSFQLMDMTQRDGGSRLNAMRRAYQ